jgi:hypothetical protein
VLGAAASELHGIVQYRWKSRKVLVVDEVGILGCKDFLDVNAHLQTFRQSPKPFGGRW